MDFIDDTTFASNMANLATTYFDTTSEFNHTHKQQKEHFSFQTVRGLDWKQSVAKILKTEKFQALAGEEGILRKALKEGIGMGILGEATAGAAIAGALTDFVVDAALSAFEQPPIQEQYQEGTWILIFRGHDHDKQRLDVEMRAETAMFGDFDDVMQKNQDVKLFAPGFYVNMLKDTTQHVVYSFDINEPIIVDYRSIRPVTDPSKRLEFDRDTGMTEVRALYFLRERADNIPYAYCQVGDEVIYNGQPYVVVKAEAESLLIKNPDTNDMSRVDPQAVTKGMRSHWRQTEPNQFRTTTFTLSRGEFVYRPLLGDEYPPTTRANGVLSCIRLFDGKSTCEVIDAWTGNSQVIDANRLVKPPLNVRQVFREGYFHHLRKDVLAGNDCFKSKMAHHTQFEDVCWGYDMQLLFPEASVIYSGTPGATQGEGMTTRPQMEYPEVANPKAPEINPKDSEVNPVYWFGAGTFFILFLMFK